VHAIVLANYEKFSSTVKDFQVLYSVQSPNLADDDDEEAGEGTAGAPKDGDAGAGGSGAVVAGSGGKKAGGAGAGAGAGWQELGTFQARERAGEQRFEVDPPRYARYLKVRFLTHWSKEFYCTLSQIKVRASERASERTNERTSGKTGDQCVSSLSY
jgi:hypothetical protein